MGSGRAHEPRVVRKCQVLSPRQPSAPGRGEVSERQTMESARNSRKDSDAEDGGGGAVAGMDA